MTQTPKESDDPLIDIANPDVLCKDMDSDCLTIEKHVHCWMHQPERGICPFLWCNTDKLDVRSKK